MQSRAEARLEFIASGLEAIALRLEGIASRLEATASRLEAIASTTPYQVTPAPCSMHFFKKGVSTKAITAMGLKN